MVDRAGRKGPQHVKNWSIRPRSSPVARRSQGEASPPKLQAADPTLVTDLAEAADLLERLSRRLQRLLATRL